MTGARLAVLILVAVAVGHQFTIGLRDGAGFDPVNFFSYFTILSNLLAAVTLGLAAVKAPRPGWLEWLRGAAVVYMVTTGVVYGALLADLPDDLQLTAPWVNTVLHRVVPVLVVLDWLVDPPHRRIGAAGVARWLLPPLGWVGYTLLRGPVADWYPYPFLDPRSHGYGRVTLTCAVIAVGVAVVTVLVAWTGSRLASGAERRRLGGGGGHGSQPRPRRARGAV